jgi:hypothetical protein
LIAPSDGFEPIDRPHRSPPAPARMKTSGLQNVLVLVPLALSFAVYRSLTTGYFFSDDFHLLYWLANNRLAEFLLAPYGGHLCVVRNVMFLVLNRLAGTQPASYYWVGLLTHLTNVGLLFLVVHVLTGSPRLACFGAALWGMSPLDEGALSWLSVYGQVVTATAILIILYRVAAAAERGGDPSRIERAVWYGLALVAMLSFGGGIAAALTLPLVIALLLPRSDAGLRIPPLSTLWVVLPALYLLNNLAYCWLSGRSLEAILPLASYSVSMSVVISAVGHLIAYGATQLVLGFLYAPGRYPDATAACGIAVFTAAYLAGAIWSPPRVRRQLLAAGLLVVANYGMIAVGRGVFFTMGGAYASQARYHYLGAIYLTLVLCLLLNRAGDWPLIREPVKNGLLILWLAASAVSWRATGWTFDHHEKDRNGADRVLTALRAEIRAAPPGADVYIANRSFGRFGRYVGMADFPGWAALFTIYFPSNVVGSHRIYFVENDPEVRDATARGRRTGTLIVPSAPPPDAAGQRRGESE